MRQIELSRGLFAVVDAEDYARVSTRNWYATRAGKYGFRVYSDTVKPRIALHRFILGTPNHLEVDHKDGNGLNCTRSNMRECPHRLNQCSQRPQIGTSSIYKGVSWSKRSKKWHAYIKCQGKRTHLGFHVIQEDAARAYNKAALKLFGEYARLNSVQG